MTKDNVIEIKNPEPFVDDPKSNILRTGDGKLLAEAFETEIESFLSQHTDRKDDPGIETQIRIYCVAILLDTQKEVL